MAIRISKPTAQLPRNAFDLSQRHVFSSRVGLQLPILSIDCVPGDYHEINTLSLTRSMPLKTDAFTALKQNFKFVFVPYQQIWRYWNDFINQSSEHFSTYEGVSSPNGFTPYSFSAVPHFDLQRLINSLHDLYFAITYVPDLSSERVLITSNNAAGRSSLNFYKIIDGVLRLLDLLGYGSYYEFVYHNSLDNTDFDELISSSKPNMFRLCAYQKAWFDYERNSIYDNGNVLSFNLDYLTNANSDGEFDLSYFESRVTQFKSDGWANTQETESIFDLIAPFLLHDAQWQRDKFTSLYPTPQFGSLSEVTIEGVNIQNDLVRDSSSPMPGVYAVINSTANKGTLSRLETSNSTSWTIPNAFSVYELRYAQMIQKWKEAKLRAGSRTKDLAKAIFGESPKYALDQYSDFVDGFSDYINISEVVSTSQTDGADLGELAGKGVGAGNHTVKFKCSDYGVLLCLYDVVPNVEYDAYMLDKQNTMVEFANFFNPFFMDQGFEPITLSELANSFSPTGRSGNMNMNQILGYAPHDQCYKQAVSKVHGEFMSGRTLSHWVTPRANLTARIRKTASSALYAADMYVHPADVDSIFVGQDNASYGDAIYYQENDQLLNNFNFEIKSVRNMSVLGLPRW